MLHWTDAGAFRVGFSILNKMEDVCLLINAQRSAEGLLRSHDDSAAANIVILTSIFSIVQSHHPMKSRVDQGEINLP